MASPTLNDYCPTLYQGPADLDIDEDTNPWALQPQGDMAHGGDQARTDGWIRDHLQTSFGEPFIRDELLLSALDGADENDLAGPGGPPGDPTGTGAYASDADPPASGDPVNAPTATATASADADAAASEGLEVLAAAATAAPGPSSNAHQQAQVNKNGELGQALTALILKMADALADLNPVPAGGGYIEELSGLCDELTALCVSTRGGSRARTNIQVSAAAGREMARQIKAALNRK